LDCELFPRNYSSVGFLFLPLDDWRTSKNLSTETAHYVYGPEFDNFSGGENSMRSLIEFVPGKTGWVLMGG